MGLPVTTVYCNMYNPFAPLLSLVYASQSPPCPPPPPVVLLQGGRGWWVGASLGHLVDNKIGCGSLCCLEDQCVVLWQDTLNHFL